MGIHVLACQMMRVWRQRLEVRCLGFRLLCRRPQVTASFTHQDEALRSYTSEHQGTYMKKICTEMQIFLNADKCR